MQIYYGVEDIPVPEIDLENYHYNDALKILIKEENKYEKEIRNYCKINGKGELAGEQIYFPMGSGYATYVVFSTDPLELIWLPIGEQWEFPWIHRLKLEDIEKIINDAKYIMNHYYKNKKAK